MFPFFFLQERSSRRETIAHTVVELSKDLCDWILPEINVNGKELDLIVGDANVEVPKIEADVALWDIWETLFAVDGDDVYRMHKKCRVGRTWFWGAGSRG